MVVGFDWLLGRFKNKSALPSSSKMSPWKVYYSFDSKSSSDSFAPYSFESLIRRSYLGNVIAYWCIRMVSESCASVPVNLFSESKKVTDHPILSMLRRPNPIQGKAEFLDDIFSYLQTSGNSYVQFAQSDDLFFGEFYVLRPDRVKIITDRYGWPEKYEYNSENQKLVFPAGLKSSQILHLRTFNPLDDHYGLSPLAAASMSIEVHNSTTKWNKSLLENAARPSGALVYKSSDGFGQLSDSQYERLVNELEGEYQGAVNAGRPMLLEGGLDWKPMGFSPSDMEFMQTKNAAAREIASAFGVPPMLLGLPGDNTYSNYQEANRAFTRDTILPMVTRVYSSLSFWLSEHFQEDIRLEPILDALPALSEERASLWKRISDSSFLTDEEKRSFLGIDQEGG